MKKVTSILRRDMTARQNPPTPVKELPSANPQPSPQSMITTLPQTSLPSNPNPITPTEPRMNSPKNSPKIAEPLPMPPQSQSESQSIPPKPIEKMQSPSVAEKLLKARSAMKEKMTKQSGESKLTAAPEKTVPASDTLITTPSAPMIVSPPPPPSPSSLITASTTRAPTIDSDRPSPSNGAPKKTSSLLVPSRVARKIVPKESK